MTGSHDFPFTRRGRLLVPADTAALPTVVDAAPADVDQADPSTVAVTERRLRRAERLAAGDTSKVRRFTNRVAEEKRLADVTDPAVIRAQATNAKAADLEALAADPRAEAYANRKIRLAALSMTGAGITLGVLISSSAAQATIAHFMKWTEGTLAYWAAYGADPALGLVLFATLLVRAVATARGVVIPEGTRKVFDRIELALFVLVALLNAGPALGSLLAAGLSGAWSALGPAAMVLVIHTLGPVLVACGVFGLPYTASVLAAISAATTARQVPAHAAPAPINLPEHAAEPSAGDELSTEDRRILADVRTALDAGEMDVNPTGYAIYRRVMGGRGDKARAYRVAAALAGYQPEIRAVS